MPQHLTSPVTWRLKNKDGTEQEIYIVRFSFIPNELNVIEPFRLNSTYNADALYAGNIHPDPFLPHVP